MEPVDVNVFRIAEYGTLLTWSIPASRVAVRRQAQCRLRGSRWQHACGLAVGSNRRAMRLRGELDNMDASDIADPGGEWHGKNKVAIFIQAEKHAVAFVTDDDVVPQRIGRRGHGLGVHTERNLPVCSETYVLPDDGPVQRFSAQLAVPVWRRNLKNPAVTPV